MNINRFDCPQLKILLLLPLLLLLSGCNEKVERERQRGLTERKEMELEHEREMAIEHGRFAAQEAERDRAHKQALQRQFHRVAVPVIQFLFVVLAIGGLIYAFLLFKAKLAEKREEHNHQLRQEEIRQNAGREKFNLFLAFVGSEEFQQLSEDHQKLLLERLEPPPATA